VKCPEGWVPNPDNRAVECIQCGGDSIVEVDNGIAKCARINCPPYSRMKKAGEKDHRTHYILMLDRSGSMKEQTPTKWSMLMGGLR
jgi:hypothetical protein